MATLSLEILEAALKNGEIDGRGYHDHQQVDTMNRLLSHIRSTQEIDSFTLHKRHRLHHCTILIYCRWLAESGLIEISHRGQGGVCRYKAKTQ